MSERGVFRQHYQTDDLDASLLLLLLMGFMPATDECMRATVLAIADELTKDDLVLRYPPSRRMTRTPAASQPADRKNVSALRPDRRAAWPFEALALTRLGAGRLAISSQPGKRRPRQRALADRPIV